MKAHLISNITMAPLASYIEPWEITVGEYDSLITELIDPRSASAGEQTTHVVALFDTDTLFGDARFDPGAPRRSDDFFSALASFCSAHPEKVVITHTFCAAARRPATFADTIQRDSVRALELAANSRLVDLANAHRNLVVFDIELIFRRYGEDHLVNPSFWYAGRIRYTPLMFKELAATIKQAVAAYSNVSRKVLILDLDNTLWGGIVGETGALGIELSENGAGAIYREFQRKLKALKSLGVLLAICSKNNPDEVAEVFEKNSMMVLGREDFASIRVGWDPKPQTIMDLAETLNLGLDSFVFIDDSPVEREMVSRALPDVQVPDFPSRLEALPDWIVDEVIRPFFPRYRLTTEDLTKTEQYHANAARKTLKSTFDLSRFIEELNIVCEFDVNDINTVDRASQLTQKTNQFNLTTMRCDVATVADYVEDPDRALVVLRYSDRFGPEGIVGVAMLNLRTGLIANFLLSCRVIGRNVEDELLRKVGQLFRDRRVQKMIAEYIPTSKNSIVSSFYETRGFSLVSEDGAGHKVYQRSTDE